ncbi:hypothetical protein ACFWAT_07165 [Streptomyces syringium]|uniref:hypothetical protein n=1 Tax=Streptomyces syringium TaxID=76729 RepID=UPI00365FEE3F
MRPATQQGRGRCPREHDHYASKHSGPVRLIAAPADLLVSPTRAAAVNAEGLWAWCPNCHAAAHHIASNAAQTANTTSQEGLFDL